MENENYFLALMVLASCVSLIGAINARGTTRMILSYMLSFVCIAVSVFFVTQYVMAIPEKLVTQIKDEAQKIREEKAELEEEMENAAEVEAMEREKAQQKKAYRDAANPLLDQLRRLNASVGSFDLKSSNDAEYTEKRSRSAALSGQAAGLNKKVKNLEAPEFMSSTQKNLEELAQLQLSACSNLARYYKAENAEEEQRLAQSYGVRNGQARQMFLEISNQLSED